MQNINGDVPQASKVDNASPVATSSPPPLPTEIMLQILGDALGLPNGVHSDRWSTIKRARVDKFSLVNKEVSALVPEAFYKSNKIMIKAKDMSQVPGTYLHRTRITHPDVEQSKFVRELEFQPHMWNNNGLTPRHEKDFLEYQVAWLEKLASGVLGFPRLDVLRIVLVDDDHNDFVSEYTRQFISHIAKVGPITFPTRRLEIVVNGHSCSHDDCAHKHTRCTKVPCCRPPGSRCNEAICNYYWQLVKLLLAQPRRQ